MAAIFDFQHTPTWNRIPSRQCMLPDFGNMEFRCYHVYQLRLVQLNFQSRHLGFLTSAYLLAAYYHCYNTSGVSAQEQEINYAFKFFTVFIYKFLF